MSYSDLQTTNDSLYEAKWKAWYASLSYGERATLRSLKLHRPWVEKKKFGSAQDARDEADLQDRLPELARHEMTPDVVISEREDRQEMDVEKLQQELMNRHFHFFCMFMGTGVEQYDLLRFRAVIMLKHAAPGVLARYGLANDSALAELRRLRKAQGVAAGLHSFVPLAEVLTSAAEDDEIEAASDLHLEVRAFRLLRFGEFCEELAKRSRSLDQWVKNFVAWARRTKPKELAGLGDSQTAVSRKFGEQRATVSAREIRVVEQPMKEAGMAGYHVLGGTKRDSHREACAKAQQGNTNRRAGERKKASRDS